MSHRGQPEHMSSTISLFIGDFALSIISARRNTNKLPSVLRPIEAKRMQFEGSPETDEMES